ncbi:MAG: hypothetical protein KBC53_11760 [Nitrosomonas sp.]|nr:hypothetical protein [Nitrosomonas sp.]
MIQIVQTTSDAFIKVKNYLKAKMIFLKMILFAIAVVAIYSCGYIHRGWKEDADKAKSLNEMIKQQPKMEAEKYAAEKSLETKLNVLLDNAVKLDNEVENEAKKPVNVNCKFSATGVQLINAAARDKPAL